jgi:hypothetical protein
MAEVPVAVVCLQIAQENHGLRLMMFSMIFSDLKYVYVCETGEYFPDGHFDISG